MNKVFSSVKKYSFFLTLILAGLSLASYSYAQLKIPVNTPIPDDPNFEFMISWKAINYVPASFFGKILVGDSSTIKISFDAIDKGKFVDLSNQNIEWYLNDKLINFGKGLKSVIFTSAQNADQEVKIVVPNYSGTVNGKTYKSVVLTALTTIPISSPEIVIDAPYFNKQISIGEKTFQALPYFFNIQNINQLKITWNVDGTETSGQANRQDILTILTSTEGQVAEGMNIGIKVFAQNPANQFEFAQSYINLDIR